jgi:hypothetical protein
MKRGSVWVLSAAALVGVAGRAAAEPMFLGRQYARCTTCHFSPTGGGLLTPYGRSLTREELSTLGPGRGAGAPGREQEFLYGLLGDALGPVSAWIDLRPSHLDVRADGFRSTRDFLMNAELTAAGRWGAWTLYAEVGRQPRTGHTRVDSFEHWVSFQGERGLGFRAGRFIPAYGLKLADHTAFTRASLALDNDNQIYGLELSYTGSRHLVQLSLGPGFADGVGDPARRAFTATARWQYDLQPRVTLVTSGLFRDGSGIAPRSGAFGVAFGVAPVSRLTLWTQVDARLRQGAGGAGYTFLADAALEVYRGVWLTFSPQLLTDFGDPSSGAFRLNLGLKLFPRTHWNVVLSYYDDRVRGTDSSTRILLAQLHLYL